MADFAQRRREKQPLEYPSAGSTFKAPPGALRRRPHRPVRPEGQGGGGAQVSEKHAGFLINRGAPPAPMSWSWRTRCGRRCCARPAWSWSWRSGCWGKMDGYTREELDEALTAVQSIIHKCEAARKKFPRGTARHTLLERRLRAMYLSRALICRELSGADGREIRGVQPWNLSSFPACPGREEQGGLLHGGHGLFLCGQSARPLIPKFAELGMAGTGEYDRVVLVTDVRSGTNFSALFQSLEALEGDEAPYRILYMDASDDVIIKRYKGTRRSHPPGGGMRLPRRSHRPGARMLAPLRERAEFVVDTSDLSTAKLRGELLRLFGRGSQRGL